MQQAHPLTVVLALCPHREVVAEPTYFPSFSPRDFPACAEAAQRSLELAQQAVARTDTANAEGPDQALAQKELAYAEAQAARFANGTAQRPERDDAQGRYAELMEAAGADEMPMLSCVFANSKRTVGSQACQLYMVEGISGLLLGSELH